jgi:transposase, IS30 family
MANHLTMEERDRIAQLRFQGADQKEIAQAIGRSPATISRELRRNRTDDEYLAAQAQREAERRRQERPLVRKMDDPETNETVRAGLAQNWAPEQIAGRMQQQESDRCISPQTIYAWIKQDENRKHWKRFCGVAANVETSGKTPRRPGMPPGSTSVRKSSKSGCGWVISKVTPCWARRAREAWRPSSIASRGLRSSSIPARRDKDADHVHEKIKQRLKELDEERCRSITFDNGTEFVRCHRLEKHLGLQLYFADPGCPYQRGTNENTNGLIRQYFPKGTDFRKISHNQVRQVENLLNNRPRACLDFRTPNEVFFAKTTPSDCD